jgi:hypothetical protein
MLNVKVFLDSDFDKALDDANLFIKEKELMNYQITNARIIKDGIYNNYKYGIELIYWTE